MLGGVEGFGEGGKLDALLCRHLPQDGPPPGGRRAVPRARRVQSRLLHRLNRASDPRRDLSSGEASKKFVRSRTEVHFSVNWWLTLREMVLHSGCSITVYSGVAKSFEFSAGRV